MRNKHLIEFAKSHGISRKVLGALRQGFRSFRMKTGNEFIKERIAFATAWNNYPSTTMEEFKEIYQKNAHKK